MSTAKPKSPSNKGDLESSEAILKKEITHSRNLLPNLGLLTQVQIAMFDKNFLGFPTTATVALNAAEQTLAQIESLDDTNKFAQTLQEAVSQRREMLANH